MVIGEYFRITLINKGVNNETITDRITNHTRRCMRLSIIRGITYLGGYDMKSAQDNYKFSISGFQPIDNKIFSIKGYDIYQCSDGWYGMAKEGEPAPHCGYKYLWVMLQYKGI